MHSPPPHVRSMPSQTAAWCDNTMPDLVFSTKTVLRRCISVIGEPPKRPTLDQFEQLFSPQFDAFPPVQRPPPTVLLFEWHSLGPENVDCELLDNPAHRDDRFDWIDRSRAPYESLYGLNRLTEAHVFGRENSTASAGESHATPEVDCSSALLTDTTAEISNWTIHFARLPLDSRDSTTSQTDLWGLQSPLHQTVRHVDLESIMPMQPH